MVGAKIRMISAIFLALPCAVVSSTGHLIGVIALTPRPASRRAIVLNSQPEGRLIGATALALRSLGRSTSGIALEPYPANLTAVIMSMIQALDPLTFEIGMLLALLAAAMRMEK